MQKIQFYLVPNRVTVTTDVAGYNTEYRQVYTRTIKLYKGIDNTLEFEIKNSEQRRQDVMGSTIVVKFFDSDRKQLLELTGTPMVGPGLMQVVVPAESIAKINTQYLYVTAKLVKNSVDTILYGDSQFGLAATCELLDGYNAAPDFTDELTVFNYEFDANAYFSEIGEFGQRINEDIETSPTRSITIEIYPQAGFNGDVIAYVTNQKSNAGDNKWKQVATFTVDAADHNPTVNTFTVSGDYRYIRFKYMKYIETIMPHTLTGNLDKIIIRN
jgi:hypothetical protein